MGFFAKMARFLDSCDERGIVDIAVIALTGLLTFGGIFFALPAPYIDPVLQPYLAEFVAEAQNHGITVYPERIRVLAFDNQMDTNKYIGITYAPDFFFHPFVLNIEVVYVYRPPQLNRYFKDLVFHELSHALLFRMHDDVGSTTIMAPSMPCRNDEKAEIFYEKNWPALIDDLFSRQDKPLELLLDCW